MSDVKYNKVTVSLTVDEGLLAEIDRLAKENDMSRSQFFRSLARKAVKPSELSLPAPARQHEPAAA